MPKVLRIKTLAYFISIFAILDFGRVSPRLEITNDTRAFADALECVAPLACALPEVPNSVRFACPGPLVDRLYVGELKRDVS